jgi:hypothetical protein
MRSAGRARRSPWSASAEQLPISGITGAMPTVRAHFARSASFACCRVWAVAIDEP